jgi:hypothetical protein
MAWTWLRSCYGFNMRVWVGGQETIYPARWFFCDPNAQWFPSPHGAEANPWLKQYEVNEAWGDDGTLKKLDRGINPGYPGQCFVGDPQWFIDGRLPAAISKYIQPVITPCCEYVPPANTDPRCPAPPCFPEYFLTRTLQWTTSYSTGLFYFGGGSDFVYQYGCPLTNAPVILGQPFLVSYHLVDVPSPCLDSEWTLTMNLCFGGITDCVPMFWHSYDPLTMIGTFTFPLAYQFLFGEYITLQWL